MNARGLLPWEGWVTLAGEKLGFVARRLVAEPEADLASVLLARLLAPHVSGTVVVGEFGAGKTALCGELARRLGSPARVLPLRELARRLDPKLPRVVAWERLFRALPAGPPLLLDGLDEVHPPGDSGIRDFYRALTGFQGRTWLLTGRTESFRLDPGPPSPDQVDTLSPEALERRGPDARTWSLETWRIAGIAASTLERLLGRDPSEILDACARIDLAPSPVLLETAWLAGPGPSTPQALFERALERSVGAEAKAWETLAWGAFLRGEPGRQGALFASDLNRLRPEARAILLSTDEDGLLRFRHRSFFDHLVARRLARHILYSQDGPPNEATGLGISEAMRVFLADSLADERGVAPFSSDARYLRVAGGNFVSGGTRAGDERPLRIRYVPRAFLMALDPVLDRDVDAFLRTFEPAGRARRGRPAPPTGTARFGFLSHWSTDGPPAGGGRPTFQLGLDVSELLARHANARLPRADEWEKAARGLGGRRYPWGEIFDPMRANTAERDAGHPLPPEALASQSPEGFRALCGDVFELVSSDYRDRPDFGPIVMGGSYAHVGSVARCGLRLSYRMSGLLKVGLRLARDLDPARGGGDPVPGDESSVTRADRPVSPCSSKEAR